MRRGPLYMVGAGLAFTLMLALIKIARAELTALEVVLWRGVTAVPLAYLIMRKTGSRPLAGHWGLLAGRIGLGFTSMLLWVTAAKGLPVADLSLITKMQPLVIAVLAPLLLGAGERVHSSIWLLMCAGFSGCVLLVAPDLVMGSTLGLMALAGAVASAGAHICMRALVRTEDPDTLVLYFQTAVSMLAAVFIIGGTGALPVLPALSLWPMLLGIGVATAVGQLLMTRAYAVDRATVVAASSYTSPIWGVLTDIAIFSMVPGWNVGIGGVLIVGAGLALVFMPQKREP